MKFEIQPWLDELTGRLRQTFGDRLLYAGLGGSYARAEATEQSDIDVNIVLDRLDAADLKRYREVVRSMPDHEKCCGFICGKKEMQAWPRHELFQFMQGSVVLHGTLKGIIAPPGPVDIRENIINTTSLLYHEACHRYIFSDGLADGAEALKEAYKLAFFVLQEFVFLTKNIYASTKRELSGFLEGADRAIMETLMDWEAKKEERAQNPAQVFFTLADWAGDMMVREIPV